jgi:hypothetical protein
MGALDRLACELGLGEREVRHILRLVAAFRVLSPDIVYAQLDEPNIFAGIAAQLCAIRRFVMSCRSRNPTHFDCPGHSLLTVGSPIGMPFVTPEIALWVSRAMLRFGLNADEIVLIPNTIGDFNAHPPPPDLREAVRRELKQIGCSSACFD